MTNSTMLDNVTGFSQLVQEVNTQSDGLLMLFLLTATFLIILYSFRHNDIRTVLLADSFLITVLTVLLWAAHWLPFSYITIPLLLLLVSIFIRVFS